MVSTDSETTKANRRRSFVTANLKSLVALPVIFLAAVFLLGCSGALESSVTGNVTLDGEPVGRGAVVFDPVEKGMLAKGMLSSDGEYCIKTNDTLGVAPGKYRVKVLAREDSPDPPDGSLPAPGKILVPKKYTSIRTSGLEYEILPGSNQIDISLVSK